MTPVVLGIVLIVIAAVLWSRRRPVSATGLWRSAGGDFDMIARFTQNDGRLEGRAKMRGPLGSVDATLLGSIDSRGIVALAATAPSEGAGRISYTGRLRGSRMLDGLLHVIGEKDRRIILLKQPPEESPGADLTAFLPREFPELDNLAGSWTTGDEQPLELHLELTQEGSVLGGHCILTTDRGSQTCDVSGSTGSAGFNFRLQSANVVLDFAGGPLKDTRIWLEPTGPGTVAEPLFLVLSRADSASGAPQMDFNSLWGLYTGHWRGSGKTWGAELDLEFAPAGDDGSAELTRADAELTFGDEQRKYVLFGGKGSIADAGFAVIALGLTGLEGRDDFEMLMLYADAMNRVKAQLTGQRGSSYSEWITLHRTRSASTRPPSDS